MSLSLKNTVYVVKWRQNPIFFSQGASLAALTGSPSAGYGKCPHVAVMDVAFKLTRYTVI